MKYFTFTGVIIFSVLSFNAAACSFGGASLFKPSLEYWEQHPGPKQKDENSEGDYWEKVPSPIVKVLNVTRGSTSPGSSCSDAGTLSIQIELPKTSTYDIEEFGFYFRVINGKEPDQIFPDVPLVGTNENGKARLFFAWLDGHPKYQFPLNLEVEVFMVTNGLNIGSPTKFTIKSDIGKTSN